MNYLSEAYRRGRETTGLPLVQGHFIKRSDDGQPCGICLITAVLAGYGCSLEQIADVANEDLATGLSLVNDAWPNLTALFNEKTGGHFESQDLDAVMNYLDLNPNVPPDDQIDSFLDWMAASDV